MLVNTFGKKINASTIVKDSKFYIEVAKFVQAYTVIVNNPNEFLNEIGKNQIDESVERLSWNDLTEIMKKCDFGFLETPTDSDLLVYYNYAIEIGSISSKDRRIATVDEVADAQNSYYNFVDEATEKAKEEYLREEKILLLKDKEANEAHRKIRKLSIEKWIAFMFAIFAVIVFCVGVSGFFINNVLVDALGYVLPVWERRYVGSIVAIIISIVMFYLCEVWQIKTQFEKQKLKFNSQSIFAQSDQTYFLTENLKHKYNLLKNDLEKIKKELEDENKEFDVKENINKLIESNEYYKKFVKDFAQYSQQVSKEYLKAAGQNEFEDDSMEKQEIILEGQFDEEAYKEKFEKSKKKRGKNVLKDEISIESSVEELAEEVVEEKEEEKQQEEAELKVKEENKKQQQNLETINEQQKLADEDMDKYIQMLTDMLSQEIEPERY